MIVNYSCFFLYIVETNFYVLLEHISIIIEPYFYALSEYIIWPG